MFLLYWRLLFIHKLTCGRHHANLLYHSSFSIYSANKSMISLEDKPEHSLFWKEEIWGQWKCKVFNLLLPSPLSKQCALMSWSFSQSFQWLPALTGSLHNPLSASWEKFTATWALGCDVFSVSQSSPFCFCWRLLLLVCFTTLSRFVLHSRNFFPKKLLNCSWKSTISSSFPNMPPEYSHIVVCCLLKGT